MADHDEPADRRHRLERLRHARSSLSGELESGAARQQARGMHSRGYLPHVKVEGGTYFITFRLNDSIPASAAERMRQEIETEVLRERERWLIRIAKKEPSPPAATEPEEDTVDAVRARHRAQFAVLDRWLDAGHGACWLRRPEVATVVATALKFFVDDRYELKAWCVMPNHVHAVVRPSGSWALSQILHSWKSFTAKEAAKVIGSDAPRDFRMPESYDHWCRDEGEILRCCRYTKMNPVKANLCRELKDWPWCSA